MNIKGMGWNYKTKLAKCMHEECAKREDELLKIRMKEYEEEQKRKEEQREKELKEGVALFMLLRSVGNEETLNEACDTIKSAGLVDGYK